MRAVGHFEDLDRAPASASPAPGGSRSLYSEPDAIVINVPEQDLNRLLQAAFRAKGGPRFEGRHLDAGRGLRGVHYQVDVSEPVVKLGEGGRLSLSLEIEKADLEVERWERRLAGRLAYCENAGLTIGGSGPVRIDADLSLEIVDGDLDIVPKEIKVEDAGNIHLVKPSRCGRTLLPTWLLWRLGRTHLRHEIGNLNKTLLARATRSAETLGGDEGLFQRRWRMRSLFDPRIQKDFELSPRYLDTSQGSLLVSLAGSSRTAAESEIDEPSRERGASKHIRRSSSDAAGLMPHRPVERDRVDGGRRSDSEAGVPEQGPSPLPFLDRSELPPDRPSLAISKSFLNAMLGSAFSGSTGVTRKARGDFSRLMKSSAVYALIPGIRGVTSRENLSFSFAFQSPPTVDLRARDEGAEILVRFGGIEMSVWEKRPEGPVRLGTVVVDSGTVGVAPVPSALGGVSFKVVQNEWHVSSDGIEFDDTLFEATLQELMFAEAFETLSEPLLREGLSGGGMMLAPRAFRAVDGYLIVELDAMPSRPLPSPTPETAAAGGLAGARDRAGASSFHANK